MEFFPHGKLIDFMKYRNFWVSISMVINVLAIVIFFYPGPHFGIDFDGGTEVQLRFKGTVDSGVLRSTLEKLGYSRPDVVGVEGRKNEYLIRVQEVSSLSASEQKKVEAGLQTKLGADTIERLVWSPGGDKVSIDLKGPIAEADLQTDLESLGVRVRTVTPFGKVADSRYEAQLIGVADKLVDQLRSTFGEKGPEAPQRVEWVGPKAGAQLRDAAVEALLYAMLFVMVYVAFRFDIRFAPGGIIALLHDVLVTVAFVVITRLEFNLQTVAALLTIVGFSINDTIVTFDRIRENMGRYKDTSMRDLINLSTSQMLGRTIITSGTAILSLTAFLIWGTPLIRDLALTLIVGFATGIYSSIYIAAPMTEWMDKHVYRRAAA